jgi:hypothetical protein
MFIIVRAIHFILLYILLYEIGIKQQQKKNNLLENVKHSKKEIILRGIYTLFFTVSKAGKQASLKRDCHFM